MKLDGVQTFLTSFLIGVLNLAGLSTLVLMIRSEQRGVDFGFFLRSVLMTRCPLAWFSEQ